MDKKNNLILVKHPLISHNLSIIRDKTTNSDDFRNASKSISKILIYKATENLLLENKKIETPNSQTISEVLKKDFEIIVAPILRAGLIISEVFQELVPNIKIQHLGLYRNEKTLEPVWYYNKLKQEFKNPQNCFVYICDPMLATGGSAIEVVKVYVKEKKVPEENIVFLNLIACPVGIEKLFKIFPKIKIITSAVDEILNEKGYIVPGLGDAGDRIFNTLY